MDKSSLRIIKQTNDYAAGNYDPLRIVILGGQGAWAHSSDYWHYLDCLACYSALNFGYGHPRLVQAAISQLKKVCVTSRAVYTENLGQFCEAVSGLCGFGGKVLPMNTGAEGVETAIKIARKWGYKVKKVKPNEANIVFCTNNFHGRTITIISGSTEEQYRDGFGPFTPGIRFVPFGNANALSRAVDENTVGFLVEPIQGEGGVNVPHNGYLKDIEQICEREGILMIVDEVQTGFGRTGCDLAYQHDDVIPDIVVLGKALGGGILPVSAVVARKSVMNVIKPGDHGSTFGGNPLACAVGIEAVKLLKEERLSERSKKLGSYLLAELKEIKSPAIRDIRGRGLMIGIEMRNKNDADSIQWELLKRQVLVGKTRNVIRINPPLVILESELDVLVHELKIALTP